VQIKNSGSHAEIAIDSKSAYKCLTLLPEVQSAAAGFSNREISLHGYST
jgi:hypothetical protein